MHRKHTIAPNTVTDFIQAPPCILILTPNPYNASLSDLQAAQPAGNRETYRRCLEIIILLTGISRDQVMKVYHLSESAVKKIIRAFNSRGVDGLIAKEREVRKVRDDQPAGAGFER
jgi:hypothetical protein